MTTASIQRLTCEQKGRLRSALDMAMLSSPFGEFGAIAAAVHAQLKADASAYAGPEWLQWCVAAFEREALDSGRTIDHLVINAAQESQWRDDFRVPKTHVLEYRMYRMLPSRLVRREEAVAVFRRDMAQTHPEIAPAPEMDA